jgi:hypothetical protein
VNHHFFGRCTRRSYTVNEPIPDVLNASVNLTGTFTIGF